MKLERILAVQFLSPVQVFHEEIFTALDIFPDELVTCFPEHLLVHYLGILDES